MKPLTTMVLVVGALTLLTAGGASERVYTLYRNSPGFQDTCVSNIATFDAADGEKLHAHTYALLGLRDRIAARGLNSMAAHLPA
jgi:hypothetical protein